MENFPLHNIALTKFSTKVHGHYLKCEKPLNIFVFVASCSGKNIKFDKKMYENINDGTTFLLKKRLQKYFMKTPRLLLKSKNVGETPKYVYAHRY